MNRGQSAAIVFVYFIIGCLVIAAFSAPLISTIVNVKPYTDVLTSLLLSYYPGLIFLVMLLGIYESLKPVQPQGSP